MKSCTNLILLDSRLLIIKDTLHLYFLQHLLPSIWQREIIKNLCYFFNMGPESSRPIELFPPDQSKETFCQSHLNSSKKKVCYSWAASAASSGFLECIWICTKHKSTCRLVWYGFWNVLSKIYKVADEQNIFSSRPSESS